MNPTLSLLTDFCQQLLKPGIPVLVGLSGPQGAGKSTLGEGLVRALAPRQVISLSMDDFYLPFEQQQQLAEGGHPLLQWRGYPGTHDLALGTAVLSALKAGETVALPRYDKGAFQGRGDRRPEAEWPVVGRQELVLLEGWCLAFAPAARVSPLLEEPNRRLAAYSAWTSLLDALVILEAPSLEQVVLWRLESERQRRERGEGAMSEAQCLAYIQTFLPAYEAWLPGMLQQPPVQPLLRIPIGADRARIGK